MYKLEELQPLIIEWAREKDLIKLENAPKQRLKLIEDCGELASAILKNNIKEQKDAIGDMFVVIVILAEQLGKELSLATPEPTMYPIEIGITDVITLSFDNDLSTIIMYLNDVAFSLDFDIKECANLAWNEIKERKGNTINGTFIKNQ